MSTIGECYSSFLPQVMSFPEHAKSPAHALRSLMAHVLGIDNQRLLVNWNDPAPALFQDHLETLIVRANLGIPLQYLTGRQHFWNQCFEVGPGVLIPRPETEILVERLMSLDLSRCARILELGAGCGNIGLSALAERPGWEWHAYEKCSRAHRYALRNATACPRQGYHLHQEDVFGTTQKPHSFDVVVSNPPYLASAEINALTPQVRNEPRSALDGGPDGLIVIRRFVTASRGWLRERGVLVLEIGETQRLAVTQIMQDNGFIDLETVPDLCGRDRVILGRLPLWMH